MDTRYGVEPLDRLILPADWTEAWVVVDRDSSRPVTEDGRLVYWSERDDAQAEADRLNEED